MKVVVAEKPSVAREIAAVLGATARHEGYLEGAGHQVTWALGHLVTLKEPQDYDPALKRWSLATLPFVPDRFGLKLIDEKRAGQQFAVVKRLLRAADEVIAATDAGREGELIFRYIQELAGATGKPARRLWLNSLTEAAIRDALRRLRPLADYDPLYAAARCRSQADWVVGLNATRFYTVRHRDAGGLLWSVGRVQTPVLALVVRRDDEIRGFKPEPFWELLTVYRAVTFKFTGERFTKEADALAALDRVRDQPFVVKGVERKGERDLPPQLFDLTELQRELNRRRGLSADATLSAAQSLYEAKLITYPRTDSRYLTADLKGQVPGVLESLRPLQPEAVGRLDLAKLAFTARIVDDAKVRDHHAIIPTGKVPGDLPPPQRAVFDAVLLRLIACFYPACVKDVTTVTGEANAVPFRARGVRVVDPGWTILYPARADDKKPDEQVLPEFRPGETGPHEPSVKKGETTPPKPYTEATLLGAMETAGKLVDDEELKEALKEKGLGTPATRAATIETLLTRGYIIREGKTVVSTDAGRYLVALIRDRGLKSPELTGEWEARLREIERDRLDPARFMADIVGYTRGIVGGTDAVDESRLGDCPRCGRHVIEGNRGFGCSGWKDGCGFVLWKEYKGGRFDAGHARELLQRRVLFRPPPFEGSEGVILTLSDAGAVLEVRTPQAAPPRTPPAAEAKPPRARRQPKSTATGVEPAAPEAKAPRRKSPKAKPADGTLGPCPLCGATVVEQDRSYGCGGWRNGCKFAIWKTIAGKKVSTRTAQALLKRGVSPLLKGFKSKSGKPFDARLKLEAGAVRFEFES
ncbi:type IA DNA topoisomerase [Limnoglobus roseus]|uniref:DNA topoisomerase n=1 Tax=Limnoglobus roseus TaxID=2598579 RepID=A0A5C1AGK3_9BACT|nr:type IA DNA topoisomerase [Limnoglobus roseus]QEL16244.1 type I DNA topoisomerase [Limnoglobus roseus]